MPALCACAAAAFALKYAPRGAVLQRDRRRALDERDVAALVLHVDLERVQAVLLEREVLLELPGQAHQRRRSRARRGSPPAASSGTGSPASPSAPARARRSRLRPSRRRASSGRRARRPPSTTSSASRGQPAAPDLAPVAARAGGGEARRSRYPRRLPRGSKMVARKDRPVVLSDATISRLPRGGPNRDRSLRRVAAPALERRRAGRPASSASSTTTATRSST